MGRSTIVGRYEITPQIKELQSLAQRVRAIGMEVNIDITQDLVTINGFRKMSRESAKTEMLQALESNKTAKTTADFPDPELVEKEARLKAKLARKNRAPGSPPEQKALIRRAKRIYKKAIAKGIDPATAGQKAKDYIDRKGTEETKQPGHEALRAFLAKE